MRRIILLILVLLALVGTGIVTVQWNDAGATVSFDRQKAREKAKQLVDQARALKSKALADHGPAGQAAPPRSP